jgi:endonuclease YncB( thermonuclease family)
MNDGSTSVTAMQNVIIDHLPAVWAAGAFIIGAVTLASLETRDASTQASAIPLPATEIAAIPAASPRFAPQETVPALRAAIDEDAPTIPQKQPFPLEIGLVERVIDGDTYAVRLDRTGALEQVRLAWIDTPDQPFGAEATEWVTASLLGHRVVVTAQDRDRFGRLVAQVTVQDDAQMWDVSNSLARLGLGWIDPRYGAEEQDLIEEQSLAQAEGIGLWSAPNPIPPWKWRQLRSSDGAVRTLAAR